MKLSKLVAAAAMFLGVAVVGNGTADAVIGRDDPYIPGQGVLDIVPDPDIELALNDAGVLTGSFTARLVGCTPGSFQLVDYAVSPAGSALGLKVNNSSFLTLSDTCNSAGVTPTRTLTVTATSEGSAAQALLVSSDSDANFLNVSAVAAPEESVLEPPRVGVPNQSLTLDLGVNDAVGAFPVIRFPQNYVFSDGTIDTSKPAECPPKSVIVSFKAITPGLAPRVIGPLNGTSQFNGNVVAIDAPCGSYLKFNGKGPYFRITAEAPGQGVVRITTTDLDYTNGVGVFVPVDVVGTLNRTAPAITNIAPVDGATYDLGSVPTPSFNCVDDPISFPRAGQFCFQSGWSNALGTHTMTATAKSFGGTTTESVTYTVVNPDTTPPVVTIGGVTDGATYYVGSVPTATATAVDDVDGPIPADVTVTGERTAVAADVEWLNGAGVPQVASFDVTAAGGTYTQANPSGSWTMDVTYVDFVGSNEVTMSGTITAATGNLAQYLGRTLWVIAKDDVDMVRAGIAASQPLFVVTRDYAGNQPVSVGDVAIGESETGTFVVEASATDAAGNTGTATASYTVSDVPPPPPTEFGAGLGGAIDMNAVNVGKASRAYLVKFAATQDGAAVTDPAAFSVTVSKVACGEFDELVSVDSLEYEYYGEVPLAYEDGFMKGKLQIGKDGAGCYVLTIAAADGSGSINAFFELT